MGGQPSLERGWVDAALAPWTAPGHVPVVTEESVISTEKPNSLVWRRSQVEGRRGLGGSEQDRGASVGMVPREERRGDCCVGFPNRQTAHLSTAVQGFSEPRACQAQTQSGEGEGEDSPGQSRHGRDVTGVTLVEHAGRRGWEGQPWQAVPWVGAGLMDGWGPAETSEQNSSGLGSWMCRGPHLILWKLSGSSCLSPLSWAAVSSTQFSDVHSKSAPHLMVWQRHLGTGKALTPQADVVCQ